MKKFALLMILCLCVAQLAGCNGKYYYVAEDSSGETSSQAVSDPVPAYVFGEKGFYDTEGDVEFYLAPGLYAKEIGETIFDDGEHSVHKIVDAHESYLLCDGEGRVYKNADLPWTVEPGEEGFAEAYPGLTAEKQND